MSLEALHHALAQNLGNKLTPELAYGILRSVIEAEDPDQGINPAQFPPAQHGYYTLQMERVRDVVEETKALHRLYWQEMSLSGGFSPDYDTLLKLERMGMYSYATARLDGNMVGHLGAYVQKNPHTGELVARDNSLYVLPDHRVGVGKALMKYGISAMFSIGVVAIESSTDPENRNQAVIKRMGFKHVGNQYELRKV